MAQDAMKASAEPFVEKSSATMEDTIDLSRRDFADIPVVNLQMPREQVITSLEAACGECLSAGKHLAASRSCYKCIVLTNSIALNRHAPYSVRFPRI